MFLCGIPVTEDDVVELARLADQELGTRLLAAVDQQTRMLGLTLDERTRILAVLDDPPSTGLAELRGQLLRDLEGHRQQGLA